MKFHKRLAAILVFAIFTLGTVESLMADPEDSQRLRGLAGRVFQVTVEVTKDDFGIFELFFGAPVGTTFPNCYVFDDETNAEGYDWFETAFPDTVGNWMQYSVGATTDYAVAAGILEQLGHVTPAGGLGVLQLEAVSTAAALGLEFFSVGYEVQGTDISNCPDEPEFTLPGNP